MIILKWKECVVACYFYPKQDTSLIWIHVQINVFQNLACLAQVLGSIPHAEKCRSLHLNSPGLTAPEIKRNQRMRVCLPHSMSREINKPKFPQHPNLTQNPEQTNFKDPNYQGESLLHG